MKRVSRAIPFIAVILLTLGLLSGPAVADDNEIRLGVISPASGNYADLGAAERRGITMAVEEINAAGGVLGKQVRMIVEDTETNPGAGARKAKKLMERDKVHFMLGAVSSSVAIAISEVAQRGNTIYFNTNTNSSECTAEHCHRTNFRVGPNNHMLVHSVAPFLAEKYGKNWFFITHDYSWGRSGTKTFREILKEVGGKELGEALIPMNTRDFSSYLIKIRNVKPKPDMIMCTIGGVDRSAMFEQIRQFGMDKDFRWGFSLMDYGDAFAVGPEKAVGIFAAEWYHTIDAPGVKEFVAKPTRSAGPTPPSRSRRTTPTRATSGPGSCSGRPWNGPRAWRPPRRGQGPGGLDLQGQHEAQPDPHSGVGPPVRPGRHHRPDKDQGGAGPRRQVGLL